jgi:hypothetical protein
MKAVALVLLVVGLVLATVLLVLRWFIIGVDHR